MAPADVLAADELAAEVEGTEVGVVAGLLEPPDSAELVADSVVDTGTVVNSVADGGAV